MVDLQKRLSKKQLAQYQREEMFSKAGSVNIGMSTRSQTRASMGFAPRIAPIMETSFGSGSPAGAASASRNLLASTPHTSPQNNLMTASPNTSIQFGRGYATRRSINTMDPGDISNSSGVSRRINFATKYINPIYQGFTDIDLGNTTLDEGSSHLNVAAQRQLGMRQRIGAFFNRKQQQQQPKVAVTRSSVGGGLSFMNPAYEAIGEEHNIGGGAAGRRNFLEIKQKYGAGAKQRLANTFRRMRKWKHEAATASGEQIPLLEFEQEFDDSGNQSMGPVRGSMPREEFMRYANAGKMQYPTNIMRAVRRSIQRHKRKLMIVGGVIGATAGLVGGIVGGTLTKQAKRRKKEMQNDSTIGVFERLSDSSGVGGGGGGGGGGGSGGGYGNYQKMPFTAYGKGSRAAGFKMPKRRRYKKKKTTTTKKGKKEATSKRRRGNGAGSGRIHKRSTTSRKRRINRKSKKGNGSTKAF